jgi:hypothetical protein
MVEVIVEEYAPSIPISLLKQGYALPKKTINKFRESISSVFFIVCILSKVIIIF